MGRPLLPVHKKALGDVVLQLMELMRGRQVTMDRLQQASTAIHRKALDVVRCARGSSTYLRVQCCRSACQLHLPQQHSTL